MMETLMYQIILMLKRMALDITLHTLMALMQLKVLERMMMVMLNGIVH